MGDEVGVFNEHKETKKTEGGWPRFLRFLCLLRFSLRLGPDIHPLFAQVSKLSPRSIRSELLGIPLGLEINFNELKLTDRVSRFITSGADLD
jgi:hypothetical protein